ncbi:unnamed protein product [Lactuca virosa]|uniref:Uncharacterized protein n=1 Tax=Lactuca virosa TaxID=75947 RepID=A0AAU9PVF3_9ASTR|nr:unnamed protein product [Lactuca virosa]
MMFTISEDSLKKLEAFMTQQTQNRIDLKAAVKTLQAKQTSLEEGLLAQSQNKSKKRFRSEENEEESVEEEVEMARFEDPHEQGQGRGIGVGLGVNPNSKGQTASMVGGRGRVFFKEPPCGVGRGIGRSYDSWRMKDPQPFKHNWEPPKFDGFNRREP